MARIEAFDVDDTIHANFEKWREHNMPNATIGQALAQVMYHTINQGMYLRPLSELPAEGT